MKTLIITLLIAFTSITVAAQSSLFNDKVRVVKEGKKILLLGKDCNLLNKESDALAKWTQKVNERAVNQPCSCRQGFCTKEVTSTIPDFAEAYQFKHVPTDGPNCWNATLVGAKIVPQLRYTSDIEMNFWMNSPLCKERKANEPLQPGDLIAIRGSDHKEVHGFIYLSENLSFSKNGYNKAMPYSLQDPNVVFDIYEVPKNCRRKTGEATGCANYANYFSCISMDDYLKKNPIKDPTAKETYKQLSDLECVISEAVLSGKNSQELQMLAATTLKVIATLAYETLKENKFDPNDKVIWQALYHKSSSLKDQLTLM